MTTHEKEESPLKAKLESGSGISSESIEHGYERTDAKGLPLIAFILFLILGTILAMGFTSWLLKGFQERRAEVDVPRHALAGEEQEEPALSLQKRPQREYEKYELNQRLLTETYSFIDREADSVLLPVDRAMELVLKEGIQRPAPPTDSGEGDEK